MGSLGSFGAGGSLVLRGFLRTARIALRRSGSALGAFLLVVLSKPGGALIDGDETRDRRGGELERGSPADTVGVKGTGVPWVLGST